MKKIKLILLFLMIGFTLMSQTNIYHNFPSSNAMWRETKGGYQCSCCTDYQYTISGDTVINNITYQKINKYGVQYDENLQVGCTPWVILYYYNYYVGAIRSDSVNKKVFYRDSYFNDTLLYDFNLSIGDTLPPSFINSLYGTTNPNYVSQIDSILVGGSFHKRFHISSWENDYVKIIEGVGNTFGLLSNLEPPFEQGTTLICFTVNEVTNYLDSNYQCNVISGNYRETSMTNEILALNIYPNPLKTSSTIEINNILTYSEFVLIDILGTQRMKLENINNGAIITKSNLESGIYFYFLKQGNNVLFKGKLLIE